MNKKEVLGQLLASIQQKNAILVVAHPDIPDIPDIHNFYPHRYYTSIRHLGFGFFEGKTEKGNFSFDGGGAMAYQSGDGWSISWTPLRASSETLDLLGYDFQKVETALRNELKNLP